MNKTLYYAFIFYLAMSLAASAHAEQEPEELILSIVEKGIAILQDPSIQGSQNLIERRERLWSLLKPHFHLEEMSKRALGYHWKDISPEQRDEFTTLFSNVLKNVYLGKTDSYRGEKIVFLRKVDQGKRSKIQTHIFTSKGDKFSVDFSMIFNDKHWKAYDVTIEGVSIISNYRSQFNSILSRSSFSELIEQLKKRQEESEEEIAIRSNS